MDDTKIKLYAKSVAVTFGIIFGINIAPAVINQIFFGNEPEFGWETIFFLLPIGALVWTLITIALFLLFTLLEKSWRTSKNLYILAILISLILIYFDR